MRIYLNYIMAQRLNWPAKYTELQMIGQKKDYMSGNRYLQDWQEDQNQMGKR